MTYRTIYWNAEEARLKNFSATTKSDASSVVKIEIEVRDPYRLGAILQSLDEIRREQAADGKRPAKPAPERARPSRREIGNQRALLLTYRNGDDT